MILYRVLVTLFTYKRKIALHFTKRDDVYLGYFISRAEKCFWVLGCMKAWLYQLQQKDHTFCYEYVKQVWYASSKRYRQLLPWKE